VSSNRGPSSYEVAGAVGRGPAWSIGPQRRERHDNGASLAAASIGAKHFCLEATFVPAGEALAGAAAAHDLSATCEGAPAFDPGVTYL
jgi:hypothetical protein